MIQNDNLTSPAAFRIDILDISINPVMYFTIKQKKLACRDKELVEGVAGLLRTVVPFLIQ